MNWQEKLVLKAGEELRHESSRTKGFMQETDIDEYSIVSADGTKMGSVTVTDHTAVKGFKRTVSILQKDSTGKTIVDLSINPG